jgi:hypothetical protein
MPLLLPAYYPVLSFESFLRQDPGLQQTGSSMLPFHCFGGPLSMQEYITDGLWYLPLTLKICVCSSILINLSCHAG